MKDELQAHSDDQHDRTYEAPAVSPLGSVDAFTHGDRVSTIDSFPDDLTNP